jgi:hypothetical protein
MLYGVNDHLLFYENGERIHNTLQIFISVLCIQHMATSYFSFCLVVLFYLNGGDYIVVGTCPSQDKFFCR